MEENLKLIVYKVMDILPWNNGRWAFMQEV